MAGELLAQVLLDIGRNYAEGKAEERALLRKEQELLNEHAYQKVLREERLKTEKELIEYKNSEEYKQWELQQEKAVELARKQNRLLTRDQLEQKARLAGVSDEEVGKLSDKALSDAVIEDGIKQTTHAALAANVTVLKTQFGANVDVYQSAKAENENVARTIQKISEYDNTGFIANTYKSVTEQAIVDKYGRPSPKRPSNAEILATDFALTQEIAQQVKLAVASKPEFIALSKELDLAMQQAREADGLARSRNINPKAPMEGQAWFANGKPADYVSPVAPVVPEKTEEAAPSTAGGLKLPGTADKPAVAAAPVVDNVFTQRNKEIEDSKKLDQYGAAYFAAQKTPTQIQQQAAMESPSLLGRAVSALPFGSAISEHYVNADPVGSLLVNTEAAAVKMAALQQQQAAAQAQAEQLASQVKPELAAESSYWNQFMPQVRKNAFGQPAPESEDAFAMMTPAQKTAWFRSHNLGSKVSPSVVAETPAVQNPYWQVKQ